MIKPTTVTISSSPSLAQLTVDRGSGAVQFSFTDRHPMISNVQFDEMRSNLNRIIDAYVTSGGCECSNGPEGRTRALHFPENGLTDARLLDLIDTLKDNGHIGGVDREKCVRLFFLEFEDMVVRNNNPPGKPSPRR